MRMEAKQSRDRSFYQSRDRSEAAEREGAVPGREIRAICGQGCGMIRKLEVK